MSAVEDKPAYSIGKGKRTFKLCERDLSVPGPAAYTIDRDFHNEAIKSSITKGRRLKDLYRSASPGPGTYDIPTTIGSVTARFDPTIDLSASHNESTQKSPGKQTFSSTLTTVTKSVESHPVLKNSPKTK